METIEQYLQESKNINDTVSIKLTAVKDIQPKKRLRQASPVNPIAAGKSITADVVFGIIKNYFGPNKDMYYIELDGKYKGAFSFSTPESASIASDANTINKYIPKLGDGIVKFDAKDLQKKWMDFYNKYNLSLQEASEPSFDNKQPSYKTDKWYTELPNKIPVNGIEDALLTALKKKAKGPTTKKQKAINSLLTSKQFKDDTKGKKQITKDVFAELVLSAEDTLEMLSM